ncbi:MAG TPA: hypothetical protein VGH49_03695 [Xanthobacteraceae bacterium]
MTPHGKKVTAVLLLALLALPTGLCSLFFTPMSISSLFFSRDALENAIGVFALICSGVGWVVCGLTIWGAVRLNRAARLQQPPADPAP